jgi:hypothetical protein
MADSVASKLDQAIRAAGVPITGVAIGDNTNRATWLVRPFALQAQAQPIIDGFVLPTAAQIADEDAQRDVNDKKLQAVALALWECIPSPLLTKVQMKNRAMAIYKTL